MTTLLEFTAKFLSGLIFDGQHLANIESWQKYDVILLNSHWWPMA